MSDTTATVPTGRPDTAPGLQRSEWTNFRLLLVGQTVSLFGTAVTVVAFPIVAVLQLDATTFEVGLITSAEFVAYSVLGLLAGVYVDRWRRRAVLLWSDAARAAIMAVLPVLWILGQLHIWHLIVAALLIGVFQLFFDTAHQAFLPSIVGRDKLIKGNAQLQTSASITELSGPGIGGVLIQWLGAALTLIVDAVSYVVSFFAILLIRAPREEPARLADSGPTADGQRAEEAQGRSTTVLGQIAEGFRYIATDKILRSFLATIAQFNVLITAEQALLVIFLLKVVQVSPAVIGFLLASIGVGAVLGAVVARRLSDRLGVGRTMVLAAFFGPVVGVLIPFTYPDLRLAFFVIGNAALGATTTILKVVGVSYRQAVVPPHLLGRVVATNRTLTWGPLPLGGLLGGGLGQLLGVRSALFIIALLLATAPLWLVFTPAWGIRDLSEEVVK